MLLAWGLGVWFFFGHCALTQMKRQLCRYFVNRCVGQTHLKKPKSSKPVSKTAISAPSFMSGGMMDLALSSIFINVLSLAMPLTLLQVYDRILPNNAESTLVLLILGIGTAFDP